MTCKSKYFTNLLFLLLFWACPALALAVTPPVPDKPHQYVVDLAGVIDAGAETRLNTLLKDLEAKTTAQVVVLTVNSLDGEDLKDFSHQTAVKWKIGQKGKDNGVLLTVAVKDRKYRIEVGYGLESTLPDSLVGSIGRQYLVPAFRKGDYGGGITAVAAEIAKTVSGGKVSAPGTQGKPPYHWETKKKSASLNPLTLILLIIFAIVLLVIFILSRPWVWLFGGGWSSGGWSSGGGDSGGFSGGGGDFGGGGASGDW